MSESVSKTPIDEVVGWYWEYGSDVEPRVREALADARIIYAVYECESYEGSSLLVYEKAGKFYLNRDSHCSCSGMTFGPEAFESAEAVLASFREWQVADRAKIAAALGLAVTS